MDLRFLSSEEIDTQYHDLYKRCFGRENIVQAPSVVALAEDGGEVVGFMSGYWTNRIEFYIQFCSIVPEYRNQKKGFKYLRQALEKISTLGAAFYITMIPNDNVVAMKVILDCGFRLIGIRQSTSGIILGEWLKQMPEVTNER